MIKRTLDVVVSAVAIIVLSPILVILATLVRINLGTPVIFSQIRPGRQGAPFRMFKFRSMNDARDYQGNLLADEDRLNRFGRLLRSSSLDELPELLNVLKGEMSIVGPRPLLSDYLPLYSPRQARRHEVRPGITGWAQVNGRNAIDWDVKFELDVWYVENQSLGLDLKIMLLTLIRVLQRSGVTADNSASAERFRGDQ